MSLPSPPSTRSSPLEAEERVVTGAALEDVVAAHPAQQVVAAEADEPVVAARAVERVRPLGAGGAAPGRAGRRARPACRGCVTVRKRGAAEAAERIESVLRGGVGDVEARAVGRPGGAAGTAAGRWAHDHAPPVQVHERGLAVDAATQLGARGDDRLRALRGRRRGRRRRRCRAWTDAEDRPAGRLDPDEPRGGARLEPLRGVVAETHARSSPSRLTPAAPASLIRRTSRPVVRSRMATAPPSWTSIARVSVTTSRSACRRACAPPRRCMPRVDRLDGALARGEDLVPSAETASASGEPWSGRCRRRRGWRGR